MAITIGYTEIVVAFLSCLFIWHWSRNRNSPIRNWLVVGMLPGLLHNAKRVHEFFTQGLRQNGWTFEFKGPWFADLDFVVTSDPLNVNHICSKNFANYPKGPEFRKIFETFGDGIFNANGELWQNQRKIIHSLIKQKKFESALVSKIQKKVENGLIPVLEHASELGNMVDMQEVFQRFTFDNICQSVLGFDPNCLSIEFPKFEYEQAFNEIEEATFYRQMMPESCWNLQKWLQVGEAKKMSIAWRTFDKFLYECISLKRERLSRRKTSKAEEEFDLLTAFMEEVKQDGVQIGSLRITDEFLRDIAFNLLGAGRSAVGSGLTWFLWLVATHPSVESRILEEIRVNTNTESKDNEDHGLCGTNHLHKFVYLHATLCETLRLYPPIPINHKTAIKAETLPSGHRVNQNEKILLSFYSMGRMEEIWGKDCLEFKPERWISEGRSIVHIPSYKFTAFHAGPRICLGKELTFIQMKMVAIAIIKNYHVKMVEGHPVSPTDSTILRMEHGLQVRVSKRPVF